MSDLKTIFKNNKIWQQEKIEENPDYFKNLAKEQNPKILFITCSDSRIVPHELTGLKAGEIFIHRNIANLIKKDDENSMAVLEYAVCVLKVKQIIICGHFACGGVEAVIKNTSFGQIKKWLQPLNDLFESVKKILTKKEDINERVNVLSEMNVIEQVEKIKSIDFIREKINENSLSVHGIIYNFKTGNVSPLT